MIWWRCLYVFLKTSIICKYDNHNKSLLFITKSIYHAWNDFSTIFFFFIISVCLDAWMRTWYGEKLLSSMSTMYLQSGTQYLGQNKKIEWRSGAPESFDICFCLIFDSYCQSFISRRETMSPPNFEYWTCEATRIRSFSCQVLFSMFRSDSY